MDEKNYKKDDEMPQPFLWILKIVLARCIWQVRKHGRIELIHWFQVLRVHKHFIISEVLFSAHLTWLDLSFPYGFCDFLNIS